MVQLHFNMLLKESGVDPREVRLLRHQAHARDGLTPYALWRENPDEFARYQSLQKVADRSSFERRFWASFVVPPDGSTLFAGLYEVYERNPAPKDLIDPLFRESVQAMERELDYYTTAKIPQFDHLAGRLRIDWGGGKRSWNQKADGAAGHKAITELSRIFREPAFPGFSRFISSLERLPVIPASWVEVLKASRGIYLLTCPQTKEQYVGAAYGADGFWGRWQYYCANGHGGNVGLKSRNPANYQVSILEVTASTATVDEITALEQLWKAKLQSREMGLNRN